MMHQKLQQGFLDEMPSQDPPWAPGVLKWKRTLQVQCLASSWAQHSSQGSAELMQRLWELQVQAAAI